MDGGVPARVPPSSEGNKPGRSTPDRPGRQPQAGRCGPDRAYLGSQFRGQVTIIAVAELPPGSCFQTRQGDILVPASASNEQPILTLANGTQVFITTSDLTGVRFQPPIPLLENLGGNQVPLPVQREAPQPALHIPWAPRDPAADAPAPGEPGRVNLPHRSGAEGSLLTLQGPLGPRLFPHDPRGPRAPGGEQTVSGSFDRNRRREGAPSGSQESPPLRRPRQDRPRQDEGVRSWTRWR